MRALLIALALALSLAGPAAAGESAPFKGTLEGVATITPLGPTAVSVHIEGAGYATHLGRFTVEVPHLVNPQTRIATGSYVFTAANGDTLTRHLHRPGHADRDSWRPDHRGNGDDHRRDGSVQRRDRNVHRAASVQSAHRHDDRILRREDLLARCLSPEQGGGYRLPRQGRKEPATEVAGSAWSRSATASAGDRIHRDEERTARRGREERGHEDGRGVRPVDRGVDVTMPGVDKRLSRRVRVLCAALAIDVDERTGDDVHDDRTRVRVPRELCTRLHRVSDDDGLRRVASVDDDGFRSVVADLDLQIDGVGEGRPDPRAARRRSAVAAPPRAQAGR